MEYLIIHTTLVFDNKANFKLALFFLVFFSIYFSLFFAYHANVLNKNQTTDNFKIKFKNQRLQENNMSSQLSSK